MQKSSRLLIADCIMFHTMAAAGTTVFIELCIIMTIVVSLMTCACCRSKKKRILNAVCQENPPDDNHNNNRHRLKEVYPDSYTEEATPYGDMEHTKQGLALYRKLPDIPPNSDSQMITEDPVYASVAVPTTSGTNRFSEPPVHRNSDSAANRVVQSEISEERDTDTDTYDDPTQIYAAAHEVSNRRSDAPVVEHPPPVPEKLFESAESSQAIHFSDDSVSAALAVSGRSSISEIPYMTSPRASTQDLENGVDHQELEADQVYRNVPYISISVRAPLDVLKANMPPQSHERPEALYSVVPEDSDRMYAEIYNTRNSATSSMTNSKIESNDANTSLSLPPDPPTVESLRNVAQAAHSRNASYSSGISESGDLHSSISQVADQNCGNMPLYATVNKANKSRASVCLADDCQSQNSLVDESSLYARVQKDHVKSNGARPKQISNEPSRFSYRLHVDGKNSGGNLKPSDLHSGLRHSLPSVDPGYERIPDMAKYWSRHSELPNLGRGSSSSASEGTSAQYWSKNSVQPIPGRGSGTSEGSSPHSKQFLSTSNFNEGEIQNDPDFGYETVPGNAAFGNYETIRDTSSGIYGDEENEPAYEAVANQSDYTGYEKVSESAFQRSDPNYESVHYNTRPEMPRRSEAGQSEPCYWDIRLGEEFNDPVYERINSHEDDQTEPNYEKVKTASELSYESSDPGYARIPPSEYGYEHVRDHNVFNEEQMDPGYEKILENKLELHIQWNANPSVHNHVNSSLGTIPALLHPTRDNSRNGESSSQEEHRVSFESPSTSNGRIRSHLVQMTEASMEQNSTEPIQPNNDETINFPLQDEQPPSFL